MYQELEVLSGGVSRDAVSDSHRLLVTFLPWTGSPTIFFCGSLNCASMARVTHWRRSLTEGAGVGRIRGAAGAAVTVSPLRSSGNHCGYPGLDSFGQVVPRGGELGQVGRHFGRVCGSFGVFGGALKGR